jgi:hypothetical protein
MPAISTYLGALKVEAVDKSHAVASSGHLISNAQIVEGVGVVLGFGCVAVRAHDEMHRIVNQVATISIRVEAREPVAVCILAGLNVGRVGQVLDKYRSSEEILVCQLLGHITRDAKMLVVVEP